VSRDLSATWSIPAEELLRLLDATELGLDENEAQKRLKQYGANLLKPRKKSYSILLLLAQFNSPIILLLIFAAGLSFYLRQVTDASIILVIVFISGLLGFLQERGAVDAVAGLLAIIQIKASVLRGGIQKDVLIEYVVPGDIIVLRAGDIVPGDSRILQSNDLFVNEATLTGETYPAEKMPGILDRDTPLSRRINCLFMGTNVVSGTAKAAQSTFPVMKLEAGYILPKVFNHWREVPCGALQ
jgi:Mg2+-importing ATPase